MRGPARRIPSGNGDRQTNPYRKSRTGSPERRLPDFQTPPSGGGRGLLESVDEPSGACRGVVCQGRANSEAGRSTAPGATAPHARRYRPEQRGTPWLFIPAGDAGTAFLGYADPPSRTHEKLMRFTRASKSLFGQLNNATLPRAFVRRSAATFPDADFAQSLCLHWSNRHGRGSAPSRRLPCADTQQPVEQLEGVDG